MAVLTEKEKLQRQIAQLSAKINQASSSSTKGYHNSSRPSRQASSWSAYAPNVRNTTAKPAGNRNRSLVLDNRRNKSNASTAPPSSAPTPTQPVARLDEAATTPSASVSTTPITTPILASAAPNQTVSGERAAKPNYVHHTTKKGNMSLVKPEIYGKFEKARLTRTTKSKDNATGKRSGKSAYNPKRTYGANPNGGPIVGKRNFTSQLSSANGGMSVAKRVVIDGATFEFAEDGNLKRVDDAPSKTEKKKVGQPGRISRVCRISESVVG